MHIKTKFYYNKIYVTNNHGITIIVGLKNNKRRKWIRNKRR